VCVRGEGGEVCVRRWSMCERVCQCVVGAWLVSELVLKDVEVVTVVVVAVGGGRAHKMTTNRARTHRQPVLRHLPRQ
jgi:hypothetical protein